MLGSHIVLAQQEGHVVPQQMAEALLQEVILDFHLLGEHVDLVQLGLQVVEELGELQVGEAQLPWLDDFNQGRHVIEAEGCQAFQPAGLQLQLGKSGKEAILPLFGFGDAFPEHLEKLAFLQFAEVVPERFLDVLFRLAEYLDDCPENDPAFHLTAGKGGGF